MSTTTFFLKNNRLSLIHADWSMQSFDIESDDMTVLNQCSKQYEQALTERPRNQQDLLKIGMELGSWLNKVGWLDNLLEDVDATWNVVFKVSRRMKEVDTAFLNAPWELLAFDGKHLATDTDVKLNPLRQIGEANNELSPSPYRLGLMFMAASPDKVTRLSYESEELAILNATKGSSVDLTVEETGTLQELANEVARYQPDVVHISCHGGFDDSGNPILMLEDEEGQSSPMTADVWLGQPSLVNVEKGIKLGFISACHTANPSPQLADSLATQLIRGGMPAVLGWGNSVNDSEATEFATHFYKFLAQQQSLMQAVGAARWHLFKDTEPKSQDWHLARLFVGRYNIGALTESDKARRLLDEEFGAKAFLDKKKQIPVAGRAEFVGRRRALQAIIRHFRRPEQYAGVLIHGMGRQGKSSLAARVARRFVDYHIAVVYGHYEAVDILKAFEHKDLNDIVRDYESKLLANPNLLSEALQALLTQTDVPILLIIDDLEQILIEPREKDSLYTVRTDEQSAIRALLRSFQQWGGQSRCRLLLTSRYRFFIADERGDNLADCLLHWHLSPMDLNERRKQLEQKQRVLDVEDKQLANQYQKLTERCLSLASDNLSLQNQLRVLIRKYTVLTERSLNELAAWLKGKSGQINEKDIRDLSEGLVRVFNEHHELQSRCLTLANGNPGLQNQLYVLIRHDAVLAEQTLTELEQWLTGESQQISDEQTRDLLEGLVLDKLYSLLSESSQELLQLSQDFIMPLPLIVLQGLADEQAIQSLLTLGLWDGWRDEETLQAAAMLNKLAKRLCTDLNEQQKQQLAEKLLSPLWTVWQPVQRSYQADYQLTRFAVRVINTEVLKDVAGYGVRWAQKNISFTEAKALGLKSIECLEQENIEPDNYLLRFTAESCHRKGEVDKALQLHERRLDILPKDKDWERAVAAGGIADILQARGELDEALRIREQELLPVFERLGDVRSKAVTQGKIADILQARGELDEALRIREQEELPVYERLGDVRSKAVTQGQIADILQARGELDEALRIREQEQLPVYERLGDVRSKAVTMGRIADILETRGELDEALRIHQKEILPIVERLGDIRGKAVTQGRVADILQACGELEKALRIREQEQLPVYERLGNMREKAVAQTNMAITLMQFEPPRRQEANQLLCEALQAAQQMRIPEAGQIRRILKRYDMQCDNDEGMSGEEMLQVLFSELSRLPEEQRAELLSQLPEQEREMILGILEGQNQDSRD
jgi:CHAT domain-containing protein/tetratricopeptide (TPR) repeat protein